MLDQLVRLGLLDVAYRVDVALAREVELRLDRLHGERAARRARRLERRRDLARGGQRLRPRRLGPLGAREDAVDRAGSPAARPSG